MGKLPGKILFMMILYGAGFLTAIYLLVPSPAQAAEQTQKGVARSQSQNQQMGTGDFQINSMDWVVSVRTGIDTCITLAEEYALRAADMIRVNTGQGTPRSD